MTGNMARAAATYQEVQVASRSPLELIVMLYDRGLGELRIAAASMRQGDRVTKRRAMQKALQVVQHLQSTLNMEEGGEVAAHLDRFYAHIVERILEANVKSDVAALDEAIALLTTVRDGWAQIAAAPVADPVPHAVAPVAALGR